MWSITHVLFELNKEQGGYRTDTICCRGQSYAQHKQHVFTLYPVSTQHVIDIQLTVRAPDSLNRLVDCSDLSSTDIELGNRRLDKVIIQSTLRILSEWCDTAKRAAYKETLLQLSPLPDVLVDMVLSHLFVW